MAIPKEKEQNGIIEGSTKNSKKDSNILNRKK